MAQIYCMGKQGTRSVLGLDSPSFFEASDQGKYASLMRALGFTGLAVVGGAACGAQDPYNHGYLWDYHVKRNEQIEGTPLVTGGTTDRIVLKMCDTPQGGNCREYPFRVRPDQADAIAFRLIRGNGYMFVPDRYDTIQLEDDRMLGDVPYNRDLDVKQYELVKQEDVHRLKIDHLLAFLDVTYDKRNWRVPGGMETKPYRLAATGQSLSEAHMLRNNLAHHRTLNVLEPYVEGHDAGRGLVGGRSYAIYLRKTENGTVIVVPAKLLKFADREITPVWGKRKDIAWGNVQADGVRIYGQHERPCVQHGTYKPLCGPTTRPARPRPRPQPAKKPAPKPRKR